MFKIQKIENSSFYSKKLMEELNNFALKKREEIDQRWAKNLSTKRKEREEILINKRKDLELEKIRFVNSHVNRLVRKIIKQFPNLKKVDSVYLKLIDTSDANVEEIKDSLSILKWIGDYCDEITQNFEGKIKRAKSHQTLGFLMKKYLGKVNSLFRKNKKAFEKLEVARKFMNKLPKFEDLYTISIGGFPNVGKSTLMKRMTGSNVEVQNYPFTTKGLMFSYLKAGDKKIIQLIDTPGLLGRNKENQIEQRAQLILQEYSDEIIFVLDFTLSCGYSIEEQLKLLKRTSQSSKKLVIYLSKTDLYDQEAKELFEENKNKIKKYKIFEDFEELKEFLILNYKKSLSKFDPRKIDVI